MSQKYNFSKIWSITCQYYDHVDLFSGDGWRLAELILRAPAALISYAYRNQAIGKWESEGGTEGEGQIKMVKWKQRWRSR